MVHKEKEAYAPTDSMFQDEHLHNHMIIQAKQCLGLLTAITNSGGGEDLKQMVQARTDTLAPEVVAKCQAIGFFQLTKGGLGVTYGRGKGFLISRQQAGSIETPWSAPVFFNISQWGIGTSIGAEDLNLVIVFNNPAAVKCIIHDPETTVGADMFVPLTSTMAPGDLNNKVYALSDGMMFLDIGITGTKIEVDQETMDKAYGPGKKPQAALAAKPRDELAPLYQRLQSYGSH